MQLYARISTALEGEDKQYLAKTILTPYSIALRSRVGRADAQTPGLGGWANGFAPAYVQRDVTSHAAHHPFRCGQLQVQSTAEGALLAEWTDSRVKCAVTRLPE